MDDARHPVPRVFLIGKLTPARRRDAVKPRLAIGLRSATLPAEQATLQDVSLWSRSIRHTNGISSAALDCQMRPSVREKVWRYTREGYGETH